MHEHGEHDEERDRERTDEVRHRDVELPEFRGLRVGEPARRGLGLVVEAVGIGRDHGGRRHVAREAHRRVLGIVGGVTTHAYVRAPRHDRADAEPRSVVPGLVDGRKCRDADDAKVDGLGALDPGRDRAGRNRVAHVGAEPSKRVLTHDDLVVVLHRLALARASASPRP